MAADFIAFREGRQQIEDTGWPSTITFDLSTRKVGTQAGGEHNETDTQAGGFGVIAGTGYAAKTQAEPAATGLGVKAFTVLSWATGAAADWPAAVRSIVARDAGTAKLLCAWNLQPAGVARDLSQPNTTENVTPTYSPTNP